MLDALRDGEALETWCESWSLGRDSAFDLEADRRACAALKRNGAVAGLCNVSGQPETFIRFGPGIREDLIGARSGSSGRMRSLAAALSWSQFGGDARASLPATCAQLSERGAACYIAETSGAFYRALRDYTGASLIASEYYGPAHRSGEIVNGTRHEDLQRLSFDDASLDVVITSDVMEHVPDAPAAEREIVRVLRPLGWYLFTIPFYFTLEHDRIRAEVAPDGAVVHREAPEYHGDPVRGGEVALVYRDFSESDLRRRFTELGCSFDILRLWSPRLGILGADMVVMAVQRLR